MPSKLQTLLNQETKLVIGLMSGTSCDGIDAALVRIEGFGLKTKVRQLAFVTEPYDPKVRSRLLTLAEGKEGGTREISQMNALLDQLFTNACLKLLKEAGVSPSEIDLVGSHGQTLYHIPVAEDYLGYSLRSTYQLGDVSILSETLQTTVVSDFRVRDLAAGGNGAPLVPYTEYLLYRDPDRNVALQNIGGIGNITFINQNASLDDVLAFDTGPGNMVMDNLVRRFTGGEMTFDDGGAFAAAGKALPELLDFMMSDPYLTLPPPKTTGREYFGDPYVDRLLQKASSLGVSLTDSSDNWKDLLATATLFTAKCIKTAIDAFSPARPDRLIVGGGGSLNPTLMTMIENELAGIEVMTNEDLGLDSSAKEAVAFAILANEAIHGIPNTAIHATNASHPVIMGKITQA